MIRRWAVAFLAMLCLSVVTLTSLHAQTNQLTGQIMMPQGVTPVSSDAVFRVQTVPLDTFVVGNATVQTSTTVTIPRFAMSANYSITLKDGTVGDLNRKLKFECISGCSNIAITTVGYWGGINGIVGEEDAQEFFSGIPQVINIDLERADFFSGVVALPEGLVANGTEVFTVTVVGVKGFSDRPSFSQTINTQQGQDRWAFYIGAPPSSTNSSWNLRLRCENCDAAIPSGPYFASTGLGNPLVFDSSGEFFFARNRAHANITLTLPAPPPPPPPPVTITPITTLLLDE